MAGVLDEDEDKAFVQLDGLFKNAHQDVEYGAALENFGERKPKCLLRKLPPNFEEEGRKELAAQVDVGQMLGSALGRAELIKLRGSATKDIELAGLLSRFLSREPEAVAGLEAHMINDALGNVGPEEDDVDFNEVDVDAARESAQAKFDEICKEFKAEAKAFRKDDDGFNRYLKGIWHSGLHFKAGDFLSYRPVGRGAFGMVEAGVMLEMGEMVAIKKQNRRAVKARKLEEIVFGEERALKLVSQSKNPFCMHLLYSYSDAENFYIVMPLAIGGDLAYHLKREEGFDKKRARFYGAEICLGLAHLQSLRIAYRDIKPENCLLDSKGHVKICDLGLAKVLPKGTDKIKGRAGTPAYTAPEVKSGEKHCPFTSDWWSVGVSILEMLAFKRYKPKDLYSGEFDFPSKVNRDGSKFTKAMKKTIKGFLKVKPGKRLGSSKQGGLSGIMESPFFEKTKWIKMQKLKVKVPWVPETGQLYVESQCLIEDKNKDANYQNTPLDESDLEKYKLNFTDRDSHEKCLHEVNKMAEDNELKDLKPYESWSGTGDANGADESQACCVS